MPEENIMTSLKFWKNVFSALNSVTSESILQRLWWEKKTFPEKWVLGEFVPSIVIINITHCLK